MAERTQDTTLSDPAVGSDPAPVGIAAPADAVVASPATLSIVAELLHPPPRPLVGCEAELLFVSGGYVLHWQEERIHHYRSLSPDAVRDGVRGRTYR